MARRSPIKARKIIKQDTYLQTELGPLSFLLVRSSRRSLSISINENSHVQVAVPFACADNKIYDFIRQKARWIVEKKELAKRNKEIVAAKRFEGGQEFLFLGKKFLLNTVDEDVKTAVIDFDGFGWKIKLPKNVDHRQREEIIQTKLIDWYKKQAQEILGGRLFFHSKRMSLEPQKIAIRSFKRLWGNCDYYKQSIQVNWQIILSPLNVIDYVLVHELCHLIHPDHSSRFWKKVEKYMPDFREHKRWLNENNDNLTLPICHDN